VFKLNKGAIPSLFNQISTSKQVLSHGIEYYKFNSETCVLYYICGFVSRHINKHIKCRDCQQAVLGT